MTTLFRRKQPSSGLRYSGHCEISLNRTDHSSAPPSPVQPLDGLPAVLSSRSSSVLIAAQWNWPYLDIDEHALVFQCFIPAGRFLQVSSLSLFLIPHISLLRLFLRLLKKIELFGNDWEWKKLKDWGRGGGGSGLMISWLERIFKPSLLQFHNLSTSQNVLGVTQYVRILGLKPPQIKGKWTFVTLLIKHRHDGTVCNSNSIILSLVFNSQLC